jgi:hypothetical protein
MMNDEEISRLVYDVNVEFHSIVEKKIEESGFSSTEEFSFIMAALSGIQAAAITTWSPSEEDAYRLLVKNGEIVGMMVKEYFELKKEKENGN